MLGRASGPLQPMPHCMQTAVRAMATTAADVLGAIGIAYKSPYQPPIDRRRLSPPIGPPLSTLLFIGAPGLHMMWVQCVREREMRRVHQSRAMCVQCVCEREMRRTHQSRVARVMRM